MLTIVSQGKVPNILAIANAVLGYIFCQVASCHGFVSLNGKHNLLPGLQNLYRGLSLRDQRKSQIFCSALFVEVAFSNEGMY